ncbi:MAG TPA: hypothetical protein ENF57_03770 [Candidatus Korarchaeota archaeon]|nr:hypothetical protein [Candidatus Korarchaeota archaeon]
MARIMALVRVLLDGSVELSKVVEELKGALVSIGGNLEGYEEKPIGFGITALSVMLTAPEEDGITDRIMDAIQGVKGVSSAELERVSRAG